ncbi:hypothetical protein AB832_04315 [Flavobacteriaceae bacterium (ex Bugula neritina AB1)]|nr:hypothetical protein AB832_04315 [Flavobacteriaceae bacterium (ex Bugula neritina AB1)]
MGKVAGSNPATPTELNRSFSVDNERFFSSTRQGSAEELSIYSVFGIKTNCCVYANILVNLNKKNSTFLTPLNCALNAFILALNDSAEAFVLRLIKIKFFSFFYHI